MGTDKRLKMPYLIMAMVFWTCSVLNAEGSEESTKKPVNSLTNVLGLLNHLHGSHGEALSHILNLLLDRVKNHAVTDTEAEEIRESISFIEDPKTEEILDVIGEVASHMSMDEILSEALHHLDDDYTKSGSIPSEEDEVPTRQFHDDNRTYVVSQLDILIPVEETDNFTYPYVGGDSYNNRERRKKRKAVIDEKRLLWTKGTIPYKIVKDDFSSFEQHRIRDAMKHWELFTCLEFRERQPYDFSSVLIHGRYAGCLSNAGRIGGTQPLNLGQGCRKMSTIIHELGHAIGLYHEHSRTDREEYVDILWENIKDESYYNEFLMLPSKHRLEDDVPYDYSSIMHYGKNYFAKKAKNATSERPITILTKDEAYRDVIGMVPWASFRDIQTVSLLYKCNRDCKMKLCPNGGFQGKRCECWCKGLNARTPVEPCEKEVSCKPPSIDMDTYQIFQYEGQPPEQIFEFTTNIPSGTKFVVDHADLRCGDAMTTIECYHGIWDISLPPCEPDPCYIESNWTEDYDIDFTSPDMSDEDIWAVNISHGSKIKLACKTEPTRQQWLECSYGNWTNQPQLCPEAGGHCLIEDTPNIILYLETTGSRLQPGDEVKHGHTVQAECRPELTLSTDYQDDFETNLTCSDGRLLGMFPVCPEPPVECPEVLYAQKHQVLPFSYNVLCNAGYKLEIERDYFYCNRNGTWYPITPACIADDCVIPSQYTYMGTITNNQGVFLSEGYLVKSGETVNFECPYGFAPRKIEITCTAERWNTMNGSLPICIEVFCSYPPPVKHASYAPHLPRYKLGDVVTVNKCFGNLEQVGPPDGRIECLSNGSWSAPVICRKFCDGGQINEIQIKHKKVRAKPVVSSTHIQDRKGCQKKCLKQKRFLCLSYLYGYDFETKRWICQLFKINPIKPIHLLEDKYIHYVYVLNCNE